MLFETIVEVRRRGITICLVEQDVHSTLEIADYAYKLAERWIQSPRSNQKHPEDAATCVC